MCRETFDTFVNSFVNRVLLDVGPLTEVDVLSFDRSSLFHLPFAKWVLETSFANMNAIMLLQESGKSDGQLATCCDSKYCLCFNAEKLALLYESLRNTLSLQFKSLMRGISQTYASYRITGRYFIFIKRTTHVCAWNECSRIPLLEKISDYKKMFDWSEHIIQKRERSFLQLNLIKMFKERDKIASKTRQVRPTDFQS